MLLLKQNLNADEFKHVSEIKNEVIYECLRALKLQAILSDKRYQTICDYKDIRNDYIHDQYNLKPKKKKNNKKYKEDKEDKETYYPSLIKPLPKEELEKYLVCARWLLLKAYEEAKKIN
jgi:hypothetical protein